MAAASSTLGSETVTLRLPSGEEVDAIVPAGMSDDDVRGLMRQKHPEFYPPQVSDQMRDQALRSIPKPGVQMDEQYLIGGEPMQPTGKHVLSEATDLGKGAITGATEVSTPNFLRQLYKNYQGKPNNLRELPGKAAMFLLPLMGDYGLTGDLGENAVRAKTLQQAGTEGTQAAEAGQGVSQTVGARPPVEDVRPQWQKLGIKTSPGFQMPPVREPVPIDAATQMRQKLGLEPQSQPPSAAPGVPQFPPPQRIYRTEPNIDAAMRDRFGRPVDDSGIQEMMRDKFARDEAVNETEIRKNLAAGYSTATPKGVLADRFNKAAGKALRPAQPNEYGYKKPLSQVQTFADMTDLLRQSVKAANARKARP